MTAVRPDRPTRPEPTLRWWRELLLAGAFYFLYSAVRNTFGAGAESRTIAFRHARGVIRVEEALGLWFEPQLQQWYLDLPADGFIRGWNIFYGTAHFVVTIGVLVYAFVRAPRVYQFTRTVLAATTLLALIGFAAYTLMPPRLLDDASEFGACHDSVPGCHGYGLVDTIDVWGGLWKFGDGGMEVVSNQYAAMPSLHFGWSTWCALTMVLTLRAVNRREGAPAHRHWWVFLYPAVTLFCILVTANHYWLDAFFGGVALGGGWLIARVLQRWFDARAASASTDHVVADDPDGGAGGALDVTTPSAAGARPDARAGSPTDPSSDPATA